MSSQISILSEAKHFICGNVGLSELALLQITCLGIFYTCLSPQHLTSGLGVFLEQFVIIVFKAKSHITCHEHIICPFFPFELSDRSSSHREACLCISAFARILSWISMCPATRWQRDKICLHCRLYYEYRERKKSLFQSL